VIWLGINKKLKQAWTIAALGILLVVDYLPAARRYLNASHFVTRSNYSNQFAERPADKFIKEDPDLYYRVLDLTGSPFSDSRPSYHHKSIGGYNAAKLQRYQDVIDRHLVPEMQYFIEKLNQCQTLEEASAIFSYHGTLTHTPVMNLLNTRYVILSGDGAPVVNPHALGNAWVVSSVVGAESNLEELEALSRTDLRKTAVMRDAPAAWVQAASPSESSVTLTLYSPNTLEYKAFMEKDGIVVFGEVYYPKGWKAWIDGEEVPILRSNYITRTLFVPAGEHQVRFTYLPSSYTTGILVSRISSAALLLALLTTMVFAGVHTLRKKKDTGK
ncbi:MAG TPA: hypothetical protein DDW70_02015, partial [Rikenellaceae bacterium]|nr:hypothetical protein [Rikenellaceae bacterium]